jgi:thioesterase domain-containing protein
VLEGLAMSTVVLGIVVDVETQGQPNSDQLTTKETPGLVTNLLKQGKSYRELFDQVLVPLQLKGTKPPFFCMHGDTGRAIFFAMAKRLGSDQPFYAVQSVGLDGKTAPLTDMVEMATEYVKQIRKVQPTGPYLLGGFCMGGALALEMAQQLQAAGEKVALVAMLDTHAPWMVHSTKEASPYGLTTRLKDHYQNLGKMPRNEVRKYLAMRVENVVFIIKRQLWEMAYRVSKLRNRPLPRFLWDIESVNSHAFMEYTARPYTGKVVMLVTDGTVNRFNCEHLGWAHIPKDGLEIRRVPGLHDTIMNEPHVKAYAAELKAAIAEALQASPGSYASASVPSPGASTGQ